MSMHNDLITLVMSIKANYQTSKSCCDSRAHYSSSFHNIYQIANNHYLKISTNAGSPQHGIGNHLLWQLEPVTGNLKQNTRLLHIFKWYFTRRPEWKPRPDWGVVFMLGRRVKYREKYATTNVVLFLYHALNLIWLILNRSEEENTDFISRLEINLCEFLTKFHRRNDTFVLPVSTGVGVS